MLKPLYIVWNEEHSVGIPILDEQHHALIATINSLYYFIQEGWGLSALKPTVNIILRYSKFHQKTEEGMLETIGYPDLGDHDESQKKFEKDINASMAESMLYQDAHILLKFLRTWLIKHMQEDHEKYTPYFDKIK
jgi:hemerythrin